MLEARLSHGICTRAKAAGEVAELCSDLEAHLKHFKRISCWPALQLTVVEFKMYRQVAHCSSWVSLRSVSSLTPPPATTLAAAAPTLLAPTPTLPPSCPPPPATVGTWHAFNALGQG